MTDTASLDFNQLYLEHTKSLKSKMNDAANGLRNLFAYLTTIDPTLSLIEIEYDGGGDSGQIESQDFYGDLQPDGLRTTLELNIDSPLPDEVCSGRKHRPGKWVPGEGWVQGGDECNVSARFLIDELAWDLAYGQNPGFEINEGGYGKISIQRDEIDPDQISVSLSHSERIIETNDYEYSF